MLRILLLVLGLTLTGLGAKAQSRIPTVISDTTEDTSVTILPHGLALFSETRRVDLPEGRSVIEFRGVNAGIMPETALLTGFSDLKIEQNFDADILSKQSLLRRSIGDEVQLLHLNPGSGDVSSERATIVSVNNGVVLKIGDQYERYQCSGLSESIVFEDVPTSLKVEPTLSITVETDRAGPRDISIRYLTGWFEWEADYVLTIREDNSASLTGWMTMLNESDSSHRDVELSAIAGQINGAYYEGPGLGTYGRNRTICALKAETVTIVGHINRPDINVIFPTTEIDTAALQDRAFTNIADALNEIPAFGGGVAGLEDLGDLKFYRLPERTDLLAHQSKQVRFVSEESVDLTKVYSFDFSESGQDPWNIVLSNGDLHASFPRFDIDNGIDGTLAKPLPAGTFRVFGMHDSQHQTLFGSDGIQNTPIGQPVEIQTNPSWQVAFLPTVTIDGQPISEMPYEPSTLSYRLEFINGQDEPATIEFIYETYPEETLLATSDKPSEPGPIYKWRFDLAAQSNRVLTFDLKIDP